MYLFKFVYLLTILFVYQLKELIETLSRKLTLASLMLLELIFDHCK